MGNKNKHVIIGYFADAKSSHRGRAAARQMGQGERRYQVGRHRHPDLGKRQVQDEKGRQLAPAVRAPNGA